MTNRFTTAQSIEAIRRWGPPAIALAILAALSPLTTSPADAQAKKAAPRPAQPTEATAPRQAGEALMAIVSIKSQKVTIYDADGWILSAPVSTGTKGRETPAGVFAVVEKNKDHRSNLYDDAWMPNMLRITWNGIALHGGPLPGYAASHGCVRMPFGFAEKLFDKMRMNTRIIISPNDAEPVEFSHPALFVPNPEAVAAAPARAETLAREADEAAKLAKQAKSAAAASEAATPRRRCASWNSSAPAPRLSSRPPRSGSPPPRRTRPRPGPRTSSRRQPQGPRSCDAARHAKPTRRRSSTRLRRPRSAKAAETAADTAKARDAKLALVPVSVFISRATQKLYVRRNTQERLPDAGEMFDAIEFPVTIRNPEPADRHACDHGGGEHRRGSALDRGHIDGAGDAKDALDRITIPQEVIDRFAPTALPRSSIIISDEPLHRETNYRTEFVVALNNQPQGGLITRPRTPPEDRIAGYERGGGGGFFGGLFGQPKFDTRPQQSSPIFRR